MTPSTSWLKARLRLVSLLRAGCEPLHQTLRYEAMRRFVYVPRPDDLFIASYPKSGTTLMQMILFQLTTDGDVDRIPHIEAVSPWFELDLDLDSGPFLAALPSPRVFKTHLTRRWLPKNARCIYLLRDVRDVALSAYHHAVLLGGREAALDPFLDAFLAGHPMFQGSWFRHVASWWARRRDPRVLFVRYEEMIADLEGTVRRVAAFCGLAVPEAEMPRIVERCGIAYMKAHDDKFDPRVPLTAAMDRGVLGRGRPGAGDRELSPRQRRLLADRLAALSRRLGVAPAAPDERLSKWLRAEPARPAENERDLHADPAGRELG